MLEQGMKEIRVQNSIFFDRQLTVLMESDKGFYNAFWENRRSDWGSDSINRQAAIFHCIESIGTRHFNHILDVGCGPGILTNMLSRYGDVTGIDISDRVVTENRRVFPNIEFVSGDFLTIPSKRHSIDLVVASEIIEHIPHEKQEDFLRRVSEWLRPQAYLILTTPNRSTMERLHKFIERVLLFMIGIGEEAKKVKKPLRIRLSVGCGEDQNTFIFEDSVHLL